MHLQSSSTRKRKRRRSSGGYPPWVLLGGTVWAVVTLWLGVGGLVWQLASLHSLDQQLPSSQQSNPKLPDSSSSSLSLPVLELLTTPERGTTAQSDVRGNLGPVSVVLQNQTDHWLQDRWQAASDMHGTAIRGMHWVHVRFSQPARVQQFLLDWETAYADDYRIEGRYKNETVAIYFDSRNQDHRHRRVSQSYGQSPGVKQKLPLHIIHTISCQSASATASSSSSSESTTVVDEFHLIIRKPFHPSWGVSLWRVQAFGYPVS